MSLTPFVKKSRGFTLIELLVVIATVGILAVMLVPALGQAKTTSHGMDCMNNQKQIVLAAKMYADENQDNWVPNQPGVPPLWVAGIMSFSSADTDNTNSALLVDPTQSVMGKYIVSSKIYHCPEDYSTVPGEGNRVRSVSMNQAVGTVGSSAGQLKAGQPVNGQWLTGTDIGTAIQALWRTYGKTSSMIKPTPAFLWVFTDEHPDSINDGSFAVEMQTTGAFAKIIDFPGCYHNGACGFSFADGHAELHKWLGQTIQPPFTPGGDIGNGAGIVAGDSVPDVTWLQSHTSASTK